MWLTVWLIVWGVMRREKAVFILFSLCIAWFVDQYVAVLGLDIKYDF
jgi:hypothetical protein